MRIAIKKNGTVENVIECESLELAQVIFPAPYVAISAEGLAISPGYTEDGQGGYTAPVVNTFPALKRWQFKAMVAFLGKGAAIEAAISAISDPLSRSIVMSRYLDSDVYYRDDPLFDQLAPAVGLTSAQIDSAWLTIAGAPA